VTSISNFDSAVEGDWKVTTDLISAVRRRDCLKYGYFGVKKNF
jgi:hypothetical protein